MKGEHLIKDVFYLENVVKPPTKAMTVTPHSKSSSVEGKDSVPPRITFLTLNLRKVRLLEQGIQAKAGIQTDGGNSRQGESPWKSQESPNHVLFFPSYPDSVHMVCLVTTGVGN